jgi:Zn-dependent protease with chaperone function
MSEVAICEGAPNAFATGPSKSKSRVAVSTGFLQNVKPSMRKHDMSPAQYKPSLA